MLRRRNNLKKLVLGRSQETMHSRIVFFLLFLNVITSAAVSIYIPCIKQMSMDLVCSNAMMQMTIVIHLIGEFMGRFFCGPFIDSYGSRAIVMPAIILSIFGHFGCAVSSNFVLFMMMRFVQAIGSSVIYIVSIEIINETFTNEEKASVLSVLELYQPIAWILSPFVGVILSEIISWRLSFVMMMFVQLLGLLFFWVYFTQEDKKARAEFSVSKLFFDYRSILKNSYFIMYALIPGLFAGGYMIFASNTPFMCAQLYGNNAADIAIFQALPLVFYVLATFVYRVTIVKFGVRTSKIIGIAIYIIFGIYMTILLFLLNKNWSAYNLLALMCIQCMGSAFLVPVSVLKALQSSANASSVGASTVVVFRNIIMSLCISVSARFTESITMIMGAVFMTVGTALVLFMARRIIKVRALRKQSIKL